LGVAAAASAVVFGVFLYLVVYLPYVARVRLEWGVYAPRAIPTATIAGTVAFLRCARLLLLLRRHGSPPPRSHAAVL
jgi:hypothetical protein